MSKLINLTPHAIVVQHASGDFVLDPSGVVARVKASSVECGVVDHDDLTFNVRKTVFGLVEGLPEAVDGNLYVTSSLVAQNATNREDVVSPDTGPTAVRDSNGHIIAVVGFQSFYDGSIL